MARRIAALLFHQIVFIFLAKAQDNYNEVSLPELLKKKQQEDKNMVIVDVRTKGEYGDTGRGKQYNIGRIKGAINITLQDLRENADAIKQLETYRDKDIYLICSHSYRSRSASNILLKKGFTHVNNVRGGMTEWYRRYDELSPYIDEFLETGIKYKNISPSQLLTELTTGKNPLLLGINCPPRFFYDTMTIKFYTYYPMFEKTISFNYADSLKVWELAQKEKGRPIVLFNRVNNGAAELADWLTQKGVPDVSFLVGNENLFYEYVVNKGATPKAAAFITIQSGIRFITPVVFCTEIKENKNARLIDVRHDTLFNTIHDGTKHDYKHLKNAVNFFAGNGVPLFEQTYPDRKKEYVLISDNGIGGLEFADALAKKGYKVCWLIGGLERWEWYMNNVEDFGCNDCLIQ